MLVTLCQLNLAAEITSQKDKSLRFDTPEFPSLICRSAEFGFLASRSCRLHRQRCKGKRQHSSVKNAEIASTELQFEA
eukprot:2649773-Amphidinium_carterae.1